MLKEERHSKIIELVNKRNTLKTEEIADLLKVSLATVRRDINELDKSKKIKKVFGGAKSIKNINFVTTEDRMDDKINVNIKEKMAIGKFAAGLIQDNDFIYMDAGSSVEAMITYIQAKNVVFVTNSIWIARELSALKYKVYILPGEIKLSTDSIIGVYAVDYLSKFNFTLGFFGANGIDKDFGITTPDINEAMIKEQAMKRCKKTFVLADMSKFDKVSQVVFCKNEDTQIITNESDKMTAKIVKL